MNNLIVLPKCPHYYELVNENDDIVGKIYNKQDAEEIVKRVNEYEELEELQALNRELVNKLEEIIEYYPQVENMSGFTELLQKAWKEGEG